MMIVDVSSVRQDKWLSILVPVYNVSAYLEDCIRSIVSQLDASDPAAGGVQILLLDDCSTDGSRELAERLCAAHPHCLELACHTANGGLSKARTNLLAAARGDYIWFLDSDDYLMPGCLAKLRHIVDQHRPGLVMCDYRKRPFLKQKSFPGSGRRLDKCPIKLISGVFAYRKMYSWLKIARRDLWGDDLRFPEGRRFEDISTTPGLLLRADSYYYIPETWVHYRIRPNSILTPITRTRGHFDVAGNLDLATAMLGFPEKLHHVVGDVDRTTRFQISHFIAQEFVKLAKRFDLAKRASGCAALEGVQLKPYFDRMQQSSILSFDQLSREYLRRLNLLRYWQLRGALQLVRRHAS